MSLPAAPAIGAMSGALTLTNPLDILLASVNSNPYFIGLMMLLLNLGGRFLSLEVSKEQEKFLSHPFIRRFFLFVVLFVATRNIIIATGLTILVIICLGYLFNENSELCLWKSCIPDKSDKPAQVQDNFVGLTPELATGVWVGAEDRSVRFRSMQWGQGARLALPIYGYYMQKVYKDPKIALSTTDFKEPRSYDPKAFSCSGGDILPTPAQEEVIPEEIDFQ